MQATSPERNPERNFVRYRDHGDLPALAAVFDELAGHLLLVAGHLVRDGALAEDLVQTTFVEAMRSAHRYDAERALLPWLVRILTHHAKKLRRQRSRPDDPRPTQRSAHGSAAEHVVDREVITAVERALAELPVPYRQALTLRLVHDLSPTAIAHALGCPPNTVKTRLKRGLALLRQHLPTGIATTVALTLASGRGLAAVRADVMLQAGSATLRAAKATAWGAPPVGVLSLGVLFMNQFMLRVGLAALVLLLGWFAFDAFWPRTIHPAAATHDGATVVATIETVPAADEGARRSAVAAAPTSSLPKATFHGRCIDADTGRPIAGVAAAAWWIRPGTARLVCEDDLAEALDQGLTDDEGRFHLACELAEQLLIRVRVGREGLLQRLGGFGPFQSAQDVDCGLLSMHTGVRVTTRVVDQRGQPVAGVVFSATSLTFRAKGDEPLSERAGFGVRSLADGTVPWTSALVPGRYKVWWYEASIPPQRAFAEMIIPAGITSLANELVWPVEDERQAIRGLVTDEGGRAVDGLELYVEGAGTRGHGRCGWDGHFVIPRIGPYDDALRGPVVISIQNALPGYELVEDAPCAWGSQDVRVVVRTAQTLTVRAIDARTMQPLRKFAINCAAQPPEYETPVVIQPRTTRLADGSVQLCLARMPHLVQVLPEDPGLAPGDIVHWEPGTSDELAVVLKPAKTIEIVLTTEQGEPVAGSEVWTMQPMEGGTGAPQAAMHDVSLPRPFEWGFVPVQSWMLQGYGIDDTPLEHGTSDAAGRVRLRAPTDMPVVIAARGPGHVPRTVVTTPDERIDLRVQRGTAVKFELSPPELVPLFLPSARDQQYAANRETGGLRQRTVLAATRAAHEQDPEHRQGTVSKNMAGSSCTCDGLVPGTYDLNLYGRLRSGVHDITLFDALATVTLQPGEVRTVPVDLRRWATGHVRGQVLVNGSPWAFGVGTFERGAMTNVEVHTDADGRFEADMVCGECRFHLRSLGDHSTFWCAPERCTVVAGTTTQLVFDVRRVAARVCIVDAKDQPAAGLHVGMACATESRDTRAWTTDANGWIAIDPAPLSSFDLVVTAADEPTDTAPKLTLGPLHVPPTGTAAEFRLRLPASR
ncbi:MAG: sigma-70 family RNA polymerase sigma factor [Planctomycetota bacterium]